MSLYLQAITREKEILKNEIEFVVKGFSQENDEGFDIEPDAGYTAYKHYNDLCEKRFNLEAEQSIYFLDEQRVEGENLHDTPISKINQKYKQQRERIPYDNLLETIQLNQYQITKCPITTEQKKNYVLQKTDKSKVFHLGKLQDYHKKSDEYMEETEAYKCLHQNDPLSNERLSIKSNEVELAHLYYLPKAHKPGTPLRPIISGLKHPTKKISKFLDELLRPLFNKMASNTTVTCAEYDIADHNEKEQMKQNKMNRINDKNNNNKKLKRRINLESNQIMRYMQDNSSVIVDGRAQASATITNLQVQLSTYWTQTTAGAISPITATTSSASANTGRIRDAVDRLEKAILEYIQHCTQHVKSMAENKIKLD
ncbi:unnamed protein product [Rotaria sp. Silwood1]|nr:unnamed protein product [Rotaria sp. Silwood1]